MENHGLLDNSLSDHSKNEIAKNLTMSRVTFFKYWKELERSGAVKVTRQIGRATMCKPDRENELEERKALGHASRATISREMSTMVGPEGRLRLEWVE